MWSRKNASMSRRCPSQCDNTVHVPQRQLGGVPAYSEMSMMRALLVVAVAICSACSRAQVMSTPVKASSGTALVTRLYVNCFKAACVYTVRLNEEPIGYNCGFSGLNWSGSLLRMGTNTVQIDERYFPPLTPPNNNNLQVSWYDGSPEPPARPSGFHDVELPDEGSVTTNISFMLLADGEIDVAPDRLLTTERQKVAETLSEFTTNLMNALSARDMRAARNLNPSRQFADWLEKLPTWYVNRDGSNAVIVHVRSGEDLEVLQGQRYCLVIPSRKYLSYGSTVSSRRPLTSCPNSVLFYASSNRDSSVELTVTSLLFCRRQGHWMLSVGNGASAECPIELNTNEQTVLPSGPP